MHIFRRESENRWARDSRRDQIFSQKVAQISGIHRSDAPPDYIIPIPSHWRRRLKRPVEPAHEVAAEVAAVLNRPVKTWWLGRHRHTARQAGLDRRTRARNVKGAFHYGGPQGVRILLVDDVYTTGMTVRSAAKCLKAGGVSEVWVLTVAYVDHE